VTGMEVIIVQAAERKQVVSNSAHRYFHNFHRIQQEENTHALKSFASPIQFWFEVYVCIYG